MTKIMNFCLIGLLASNMVGCITYPKTIDNATEQKKILQVFEKDKQMLLIAMERSKSDMFESAKLLNDYISTHKEYNEEEFKEYLSEKLGLSSWYIDKWWQDVMLNYNLLKTMEEKNAPAN